MVITESAKEHILQLFSQSNVKGIRIFYEGMSCGGPEINLALDEPHEIDQVHQINDIQVSIDPRIAEHVKNSTLDYRKSFFGNRLVLSGGNPSSC